ncbi:IS5 family transposase [Acidovorax sp. LjRoot118]|uniref:IS5 family transposase n=1 Tax=Acidovorax sp. LjRoot118 TaxID=3342256 RepID=UPI003ED1035E
MAKTGRPPVIPPGEYATLREVVRDNPQATLPELALAWADHMGRSAPSTVTLRAALKAAGLQRARPKSQLSRSQPGQPGTRYGYTARHRPASQSGNAIAGALTDAEWALAQDLFEPQPGSRGRPATYSRRSVVDACCYVLRTGSSWRNLPVQIYPPWQSVQKAFVNWARQGKFEALHERLRQQWRQRLERAAQPSEAIIDSQSNRGSPQGGTLGFDAGKKVQGRKRHLVVDTLGLLLAVVITSAAVQDRDAAAQAVAQACKRTDGSFKTLWADSAYAGQCAQQIEKAHHVQVRIVRHSARHRWDDAQQPLWSDEQPAPIAKKRWVVERTHAWLERNRRLVMHHDRKPFYAAAWVWLAQARMLLGRLQ